ncbi:MAG: COQ9 family protein [Pseudomonadota bacterium]
MKTPSEELRHTWLQHLLPRAADEGWTNAAAKAAADDAGLSLGEQALAAPLGVRDLLRAFFDGAEDEAKAVIAAADLAALKVHEKVAIGVRAWLDVLEPYRGAVAKASARGMLPWGTADAAGRTWSVANMVWTAIGDTSDDYNYYSKRALLASTIAPIVLYWLRDPEPDRLDVFIAARLRGAMRFGQMGASIFKPVLERFGSRHAG